MQIVLGAGLAGLSLAAALVREDVREPIVVIDRRTAFTRDRTWCTWAGPDLPFARCATHRWSSWEVVTDRSTARDGSVSQPYVHIPSDAFYAAALAQIEGRVELRLGETVLEVGDGWARTDAGEYRGLVHDALALGSPALRGLRPELWQAFLGWEVEVGEPRFDPGVATLMDFRCPQEPAGVTFFYVLPFSPTRALVEHTSFAPGPGIPADRRRAALREWLGEHTVLHEERGRLPMTTARLPALRTPRTTALGIAGGGLRASSGYAFSRVQSHAAAVARAVATDGPLPRRAGLARRAALDAVFLRAFADDPGAFPERFRALAERVPGDVYARFMSDASSPADEARVMAALPPLPFMRAAARTARRTARSARGR